MAAISSEAQIAQAICTKLPAATHFVFHSYDDVKVYKEQENAGLARSGWSEYVIKLFLLRMGRDS